MAGRQCQTGLGELSHPLRNLEDFPPTFRFRRRVLPRFARVRLFNRLCETTLLRFEVERQEHYTKSDCQELISLGGGL